jgi:hypothetical protein
MTKKRALKMIEWGFRTSIALDRGDPRLKGNAEFENLLLKIGEDIAKVYGRWEALSDKFLKTKQIEPLVPIYEEVAVQKKWTESLRKKVWSLVYKNINAKKDYRILLVHPKNINGGVTTACRQVAILHKKEERTLFNWRQNSKKNFNQIDYFLNRSLEQTDIGILMKLFQINEEQALEAHQLIEGFE